MDLKNKEYLTIKEYSSLLKVSPQAIYQQLETSLKPYFKVIQGKKCIEIRALKELHPELLEQELNKDLKDSLKENDDILKETLKEDSSEITSKLVEMLQKELDIKNQQIEALNERLKETNKVLDQEQQLRALSEKRVLELEDKLKKDSGDESSESLASANGKAAAISVPQEGRTEEETEPAPKKKEGFFSRIFKRHK